MAKRPNLRAMGKLSDRLGELSTVPSRAARMAAELINEELAAQFEDGVDPYGRPGAPLRPRTLEKHGAPPLQGEFGDRPGDMAEGTLASPARGAGIEITVPFPGGIHQTGASKAPSWSMLARKILPEGNALPPRWKAALDTAIGDAFKGGGK